MAIVMRIQGPHVSAVTPCPIVILRLLVSVVIVSLIVRLSGVTFMTSPRCRLGR